MGSVPGRLWHRGSSLVDRGRSIRADSDILGYAEEHVLVVLTHGLDFGALLAARKSGGPSVVPIRCQDVLPEAIGAMVVRALDAGRAHLVSGALVTVDAARFRIRILPI